MCHYSDLEDIEMRHMKRQDRDRIAEIATGAPRIAQEAMFEADLGECMARLERLRIALRLLTNYKHIDLGLQLRSERINRAMRLPLLDAENALKDLVSDVRDWSGTIEGDVAEIVRLAREMDNER